MNRPVRHRAGRRHLLTLRFIKAREGATAVEFALIAGPFFLLLMGIIEIALFFFASTMIETATAEAARADAVAELARPVAGHQHFAGADVARAPAGFSIAAASRWMCAG